MRNIPCYKHVKIMDRIDTLIFKYLDGLFEKIKITKSNSLLEGKIGDMVLFTYVIDDNRIYFDKDTFGLIREMFGINADEASYMIKYYLSLKFSFKVKRDMGRAAVYMYYN